MKAQSVKRGKKTALAANKFTRSGYKFAGWNTKKNGKGKSFKNKAKVKNLAKAGKSVKLYAQWKKAAGLAAGKYSVSLTGNESKAGEANVTGFTSGKIVMRGRPLHDGKAPATSKSWTFPLSSKCKYYVGYSNKSWKVKKSEIINKNSLSNWGGGLQMWVKSGKVVKLLATS